MPQLMEMMGIFKTMYPDFTGPISAAESVALQRKVIDGLTIKDSGKFLSQHGNKQWL